MLQLLGLLMFLVVACVPILTTERPQITFLIVNEASEPVSSAEVHFATYSISMYPFDEVETLEVDASGIARIDSERRWQLLFIAPDGLAMFKSWSWCVESPGALAVAANDLRRVGYDETEQVVLRVASPGSDTACRWKRFPYHFELVPSRSSGVLPPNNRLEATAGSQPD